jgi:hypothetical protein
MYTPTPAARRPRPPSRSRAAQISGKVQSTLTAANLNSHPPLSHFRSSSSITLTGSTNLDHQDNSHSEINRPELFRLSSSTHQRVEEQEAEEEGSQTESRKVDSHETIPTVSKRRTLGLSLPFPLVSIPSLSSMDIGETEPSPPPPYGPTLPTSSAQGEIHRAPTPLRQDSGSFSHHSGHSSRSSSGQTERSRIKRATNAAKAMGLKVDFGTSGSESQEWTTEGADSASAESLRAQFLELKRQLKRRDSGTC